MLPTHIDSSILIASSMALLPCGHPEALLEVQRQMRLINSAYRDPEVLRLTDECVRYVSALHSPPSHDSEELRRSKAKASLGRLRAYLENLPAPAVINRARAR